MNIQKTSKDFRVLSNREKLEKARKEALLKFPMLKAKVEEIRAINKKLEKQRNSL